MGTADARRARAIGHRLAEARQAGDRDKEKRYRGAAEAMIEEFGQEARREIGRGRREQSRRAQR